MATYEKLQDVLLQLRAKTRSVTGGQLHLAKSLGMKLPSNLPALVAAARLRAALRAELLTEQAQPTDSQIEYLRFLNPKRLPPAMKSGSREETEAWIKYEEFSLRQKSLRKLNLERGDIVEVTSSGSARYAEVLSFKEDGRVYFKGGLGSGAWPDQMTVLCRSTDDLPKRSAT